MLKLLILAAMLSTGSNKQMEMYLPECGWIVCRLLLGGCLILFKIMLHGKRRKIFYSYFDHVHQNYLPRHTRSTVVCYLCASFSIFYQLTENTWQTKLQHYFIFHTIIYNDMSALAYYNIYVCVIKIIMEKKKNPPSTDLCDGPVANADKLER